MDVKSAPRIFELIVADTPLVSSFCNDWRLLSNTQGLECTRRYPKQSCPGPVRPRTCAHHGLTTLAGVATCVTPSAPYIVASGVYAGPVAWFVPACTLRRTDVSSAASHFSITLPPNRFNSLEGLTPGTVEGPQPLLCHTGPQPERAGNR